MNRIDDALLTALPLVAFALLTVVNAYFVAAEFALVTVDRAAIDSAARHGDRTARRVSRALRTLSFHLSGAQLGITLSALLCGYLAEPALSRLFRGLTGGRPGLTHVAALALASLVSMLFGELVPKNAALARPMPLARRTVGGLRAFLRVFGWLVRALNSSANALVRRLGVQPHEELASARSPEELDLLVAMSARAGALPQDTAVLLQRTIRFGDKRAAEAMTPRVDVLALPATASVAELLRVADQSGFSRFPIYESTVDLVTGVALVTDCLGVPLAGRASTPVATVAREPVYVPESLDLDRVVAALYAAGSQLAVVVDEYGGTDGVVTIEDLAEELVGEITDEHDTGGEPAAELGAAQDDGSVVVDGVLRSDELAETTGFRLPDGPYETLAGYLMARLGHIPAAGESVTDGGYEFVVAEVERRRVERVRVRRHPPGAPDE